VVEVGLSAFVRFVNAPDAKRARLARAISEQSQGEYSPATDFWRPMRQAIARDRKGNRDGVALREAVLKAPTRRQPSYTEISNSWDEIAHRWDSSRYSLSTSTRVQLGGLDVRLNPLFSERQEDGRVESAFVWFNKEQLADPTIHAVQQLLIHEVDKDDLQPVFIDMRRGRTVEAVSFHDGTSDWLDEMGRTFLRLAA
jgi:hypothetical protein